MARRLIVAVVLAVAVAGCGGTPKADPAPAPSTSPVSATPSPPAMPAAAKEDTKAGAIAFVRHYIEVLNYAQQTGDTTGLDPLEDPRCESCAQVRRYLNGIYRDGGTITGGSWVVLGVSASAGRDLGSWVIDVSGRFAPSTVTPSPGASPRAASGGRAPTRFYVERSDGWKVRQWTRGV